MSILSALARKILPKHKAQEPKAPEASKEPYVQQPPAEQRVPRGKTERPPIVSERAIAKEDANPARAHIDQVYQAAHQHLNSVFLAVQSKSEQDADTRLNKLWKSLEPLGEAVSKETARKVKKNGKALDAEPKDIAYERTSDAFQKVLRDGLGKLPRAQLEELDSKLQQFQEELEDDSKLGQLAFSVRVAVLKSHVKAIEEDVKATGKTQAPAIADLSIKELDQRAKLLDMAVGVLDCIPGSQPEHERLPGTELSYRSLKSIAQKAKDAQVELRDHKVELNRKANATSLEAMGLDELRVLRTSFKAWTDAFPADAQMNRLQQRVIQRTDEAITESVIGMPVDQLKSKPPGIRSLAKYMADIAQQDCSPGGLKAAQDMLKREMKAEQKNAGLEFQEALKSAMEDSRNKNEMRDKLVACANNHWSAFLVFDLSSEVLSTDLIESWISTALDGVEPRQLKMARESLNDPEGQQIRKALLDKKSAAMAQPQVPRKWKTHKYDTEQDLRFVDLLCKHLDNLVT